MAEHGYGFSAETQSAAAFFPLYPLAMKVLAAPFGGGPVPTVIAGILLSSAATLGALAQLIRIATTEIGSSAAARVPLYAMTFPTTVFLSAVYPEAPFLFFATTAFASALDGRPRTAGMAAALATLIRPLGISVPIALAVEALRHRGDERRHAIAWLSLGPAALFGWWAYLTVITGDPFAYLLAQATFRRSLSLPFAALVELTDPSTYGFPFFVAALIVLMTALVAVCWRLLRPSLAAYATLILLVALSSGTLTSSMRYEVLIFPAFIALAAVGGGHAAGRTYLAVSVALSILFGAMFSLQYWIG